MFKPVPLDHFEGGLVMKKVFNTQAHIESPYGIIAFFNKGNSMPVVINVSITLVEACKTMDKEENKWPGIPMTVYHFSYKEDGGVLVKEDMLPLSSWY